MEDNFNLEEMREQIALLKGKLERESIVNDKLLRDALKNKMNQFRWNSAMEYLACLFVLTFGNFAFYNLTGSWPFIIVTTIYMIICAAATFYTHSKASKHDCNGDLLTVAKKMKQIKKEYHQWLYFTIPSIILWMLWLAYLIIENNEFGMGLVMCMGVGAVIGGIIGLLMRKKVLDTCDEIISQIEN